MARKDKNFKALVRQRMRKTGESYQVARLQVAISLSKKNQGPIGTELPEVTLVASVQHEPAHGVKRKPSPRSDGAPRALDITSLVKVAEVRMTSSAMDAAAALTSQLTFHPVQSAMDALSGIVHLVDAQAAALADASVASKLMRYPANIAAEINLAAQSAIDALSGTADLVNAKAAALADASVASKLMLYPANIAAELNLAGQSAIDALSGPADLVNARAAALADASVASKLMLYPANIAAEASLAGQSAIDALSGTAELVNAQVAALADAGVASKLMLYPTKIAAENSLAAAQSAIDALSGTADLVNAQAAALADASVASKLMLYPANIAAETSLAAQSAMGALGIMDAARSIPQALIDNALGYSGALQSAIEAVRRSEALMAPFKRPTGRRWPFSDNSQPPHHRRRGASSHRSKSRRGSRRRR